MEELMTTLKEQIIEALNLDYIKEEQIENDAPLFGEDGLGLDSIDSLELIVLLEKHYGIRITNPADGKNIFNSVRVMAEYINKNRKKVTNTVTGKR